MLATSALVHLSLSHTLYSNSGKYLPPYIRQTPTDLPAPQTHGQIIVRYFRLPQCNLSVSNPTESRTSPFNIPFRLTG